MSVRFRGIPIAQYQVPVSRPGHSKEKTERLTVVQLEPKDLPIIEHLSRQVEERGLVQHPDKDDHKTFVHNWIIKWMLEDLKTILKMVERCALPLPTVMYMAVVNKQPVGIAMAHMPKITQDNKLVYSYRAKPEETELDWLSSWPLADQRKVKGVGQILLSHVYESCRALKQKSLFIRAANPENSDCIGFYKAMGAKKRGGLQYFDQKTGPRHLSLLLQDYPYEPSSGIIQPMSVSMDLAKQMARQVFDKYQQRKMVQRSFKPEYFVTLPKTKRKT
jgi:hypothetical protein